jgi:hypothetical protein
VGFDVKEERQRKESKISGVDKPSGQLCFHDLLGLTNYMGPSDDEAEPGIANRVEMRATGRKSCRLKRQGISCA